MSGQVLALGRIVHVWTRRGWRAAVVADATDDLTAYVFPGGFDETGVVVQLRVEWRLPDDPAAAPDATGAVWRWPPREDT